jgi:hypothetical protein
MGHHSYALNGPWELFFQENIVNITYDIYSKS